MRVPVDKLNGLWCAPPSHVTCDMCATERQQTSSDMSVNFDCEFRMPCFQICVAVCCVSFIVFLSSLPCPEISWKIQKLIRTPKLNGCHRLDGCQRSYSIVLAHWINSNWDITPMDPAKLGPSCERLNFWPAFVKRMTDEFSLFQDCDFYFLDHFAWSGL